MSNITTTDLPAAVGLTGTEEVAIVQSGTSKRTTAQAIANLNNNAGTVTSIATALPITGGTITTTGTIALQAASIDNTYLSTMPANTIKGNNTASTAAPKDMTVAQTMTLLGAAPLASPTFTGTPRAPTPATGDNSTIIATTAYVKAQGYGGGSVTSVATGTGLTGGPITSTGTISIANTGVTATSYGSGQVVPNIAVNGQGQITSASNVPISITPAQVVGLGTMATQNANSVAITGGAINGTTIGATTPAAGSFTALTATGTTNLNTVASGTWNGTAIGVAYGGTGATTASGARTNLGAAASGANSDITSLSGLTTPLSAPQGGTGFGSFTTGDLLYADTSSTLARLNDVATGNALISGGVGVAPSWGKIGLTTHVSGTLPVANGGSGAATLTGFLKGNGTSPFTAQATINNADLTNSSVTIGSTTVSLGGSTSTISGLTTLTLTQDPTSALQASTKQYVDTQVATVSNQTFHTQVSYATTADLGTVTYSNGTGGVGATITNAGAQAALTIDGYTFTASDVTNQTRVLVKDQSSGLQNGIYIVTAQGSGSSNWQLQRSTDFDTVGTGPTKIETGAATFVTDGTLYGSTSWVMTTSGTITVGTTALTWAQTSSSGNITVSAPITKVGNNIGLGTVGVANGGTGLTTLTAYGLLYAPTTSSVAQISPSTAGQPLLSTGPSSPASFGALSLSGSGVTGTLGVANGGTGTGTVFTTGSVVFAGASGVYSQDPELFWDNTNKWLGIGTNTPRAELTIVSPTQTYAPSTTLPAGTDLYIVGADSANTRITQDAYGTGNYPAYTGRQARGTAASPTASQTGDILAQYTGRGYGATAFASASNARIDMEAAENYTDTAQGTYISMHTTALGAATPVERFRVGPSGQWGIGGGTYGTSGYAFVSGGASAAPTWSQISLTSGVTGTLPATNGGTGLASYAVGDLLYASSTTALSRLADVATGNVLLSGGVGVAPSWGKVDLTTAVNGTLPVANGGTGQASALTQYGVVYGSTTSAMATTAAGTTGQILVANTGGAPTWSSSIPSGAGVTSFSAGTTGLTPSSATTGAVVLAGTLAVGNGGTGLTSYTTGDLLYASGATTIAKLADVATGSVLVSGGVGTAPAWSASPTLGTSLTVPLVIGGTGVGSTLSLRSTSGIGTSDAIQFQVGNNGATTAMYINTSGNVGIGTTSPSGKFHVSGGRSYFTANSEQYDIALKYNAATTGVWLGSPGTDAFTVSTEGGTERMRIDSSGRVLIGLTSSGSTNSKLQITGGTANATTLATSYSDATVAIVPKSTSGYSLAFASGTGDFPQIQVSANGAAAGDLLIQPYGGNVGIGTSSPTAKLQVAGSGFFTGRTVPSTGAGIEIYSDGSSYGQLTSYNRTSSAYIASLYDASYHAWQISGTERMRIDSSGNVGIGVTPSAWYNSANLQVGTYAALYTNSNLGSAEFTSNAYRSGATTWNYIASNYASRYIQYDGRHRWYYAASGTAGSAITWSEAMQIDSSGNVGIGTTSVPNKLTVSNAGANGFEFDPTNSIMQTYNRSTSAYTGMNLLASTFAVKTGASPSSANLFIDSSGNVGIGTSSVSNLLHVYRNNTGQAAQVQIEQAGSGSPTLGFLRTASYAWLLGQYSSDSSFRIAASGTDLNTNPRLVIDTSGNLLVGTTSATSGALLTVNGGIADSIGNVRSIPQNSQTTAYTLVASDNGKHISITTGGVTVPAGVFSAGQVISVFNNSGSNQTITQGATVTLRQAGTANTGNRTLAQYGVCTILCVASNTFVISGAGLT